MSRRNLIIIIIVTAIVVITGVVGYFVFYAPTREIPPEAQLTPEERARLTLSEEEINRGLTLDEKISLLEEERRLLLEQGEEIIPVEPEVAAVKPIIGKEIVSSTLAPDRKNLIYFDKEEEDFVIADLDGNNPRAVTSADFKNVYDIHWSQGRDSAIVVTSENEGQDRKYSYVNLRDQSVINYDDKIQNVTLNPNGDKISYLYYDEEKGISNISVANADTSDFKTLYSYPDANVNLTWFDDNYIQFNPQTSGYRAGEVAVTDSEGSTLRVVVGDKYAVKTLYSQDNNKFIYTGTSIKNPRQLELYVTDKQGMQEGRYLGINTLVDKCAWAPDNITVYCAVPDFYVDTLVMPNDYYNFRFISTDSFYRINTDTQRAELIKSSKDLDETYDAFQPYLSSDGKVFYFTSRLDGQLKALTIPE